MADENSNVPPQPSEAPKVAPKKETVRISLPPKPTASPTIKLPAMPAGAPAAAKAAPAAAPASRAPAPPTPPKGGASVKVSAPAPSSSGPRPVAASRPVAHSAQVTVLDKVLAIVAMIVSLGAAGSLFMLYQIFVNNPSP
jgi:hypothetical protein